MYSFLRNIIKISIISLFLVSPLLAFNPFSGWGKSGNGVTTSYYVTNTPTEPSHTIALFKSAREKFSFVSEGGAVSLCGTLRKKTESTGESGAATGTTGDEEVSNAIVTLTEFNFANGGYTCEYKIPDSDQPQNQGFVLPSYSDYMKKLVLVSKGEDAINPLSYMDQEFKPSGSEYITDASKQKSLMGQSYNVMADAHNKKLWGTENIKGFNNNKITVSQFFINLITLNSDYVKGVDLHGDIIIPKEISAQMQMIENGDDESYTDKAFSVGASIVDFIATTPSDRTLLKENLKVFSYEDHFDKKIYGLYYNFMGIAWGNIFSYAGLLFLSFTFLYSGGIVGIKYGVHKLDDANKDRPFEFPFKVRLLTIGAVLAFSFIHYPTGDGFTYADESGKKHNVTAQTTLAKNIISYMANIGVSIADIAASNTTVVYLDYLLKATNTRSVDSTKEAMLALSESILIFTNKNGFFRAHCAEPYKNRLEKLASFQGQYFKQHRDKEWNVIDSKWINSGAKTLFAKTNDENLVSLKLCQVLEKDIVITRDVLSTLRDNIEKSIDALKKSSFSGFVDASKSTTLNTNLFAQTQLSANSDIGWMYVTSLPVLHIYMKYTDILEIGKDRAEIDKDARTRAIVNSAKKDMDPEGEEADSLDSEFNDTQFMDDFLGDLVQSTLSYQVYFLLPGFAETRKFVGEMVGGSLKMLIKTAITVVPVGGVMKMINRISGFLSGSSGKSKNAKTSAKEDLGDSVLALIVVIISFLIAIGIYGMMVKAIFASVVAILIVIKIIYYMVEVFTHFFVSPMIVAWQMTINNNSDRVNKYIVSGFVLYVIKPVLIVFSVMMFIVSYEILESIYALIFGVMFSMLEIADKLLDGHQDFGFAGLMIIGTIDGFGKILVDIFAMVLAYKIIISGDDLMLQKFGYKDDTDSNLGNQLGQKAQDLFGGRI